MSVPLLPKRVKDKAQDPIETQNDIQIGQQSPESWKPNSPLPREDVKIANGRPDAQTADQSEPFRRRKVAEKSRRDQSGGVLMPTIAIEVNKTFSDPKNIPGTKIIDCGLP